MTWLLLLTAFLAGCDDGTTASSKPLIPAQIDASGSYRLSSRVDIPPTVLATQSIVDTLALLRQLKTDPASAFFGVLDQAGVPMANDLYGVLPDVLKSPLKDAINDYVAGKSGGAAGKEIDRILAFSQSAFAHFTLATSLAVPAEAGLGSAVGSHVINALALGLPEAGTVALPKSVLAALSPAGTLDAAPTVAVTAAAAGAGDASLSVGDHAFGLAYGELVFAVLDGYATGVPLRQRLGDLFDCNGMGAAVANRCVLGLCIGHAGDVTQLCERGLDVAIDQIHDQLAGLNFKAIRFASGHGAMWDQNASEPKDGLVSRIDGGVWNASIDVGTGPRECAGAFTGQR
jgi:hypothetical protein